MTDQSVRRLVHRVLMPGFAGETAPEWLREAAAHGLGGVCLFGHNVDSVHQLRELTDTVHDLGDLVVSMDEEGGIVSRLSTMSTTPGSRHVGAAALGRADDVRLTRAVASAIGNDLREVGVDLNLAPVADVTSNPHNPVIGVRAFGTDTERVGAHVGAYIEGLHSVGILSCAKHFPGHGDTSVDSHVGLPHIDADLATLRSRDLLPFTAAIAAEVDVIMTAHIVFAALDDRPATTSRTVLTFLREELGFDGLITSDAMDMRAMVDTVGLAEGSVQALVAGVDLVALGNPVLNKSVGGDAQIFREVRDAVLAAVADGRLPLDRLRDAAARVDRLVAQARSRYAAANPEASSAAADSAVAESALRVSGDVRQRDAAPVTVVDIRRHRNVAAGANRGLIVDAILAALPGSDAVTAFEIRSTAEGHAGTSGSGKAALPAHADIVLTGSPWLDEHESDALRRILATNPDVTVICTGWATDTSALTPAKNTILTVGEDLPTAQAVARLLTDSPGAILR
ncbi:glycoside hydrolase family 3 N-terminal domain-containing protein [Demetria terragena]|uniref:glycoside hydrolase family 3 N-terminal domain-containing protein n=1 Tax=Demetria terragena TaxID=63959 RepID=UPI000367C9FD|nr:glycoside hydrolase family 3 N-terminal domain-containing protein [Demetria terragena]